VQSLGFWVQPCRCLKSLPARQRRINLRRAAAQIEKKLIVHRGDRCLRPIGLRPGGRALRKANNRLVSGRR